MKTKSGILLALMIFCPSLSALADPPTNSSEDPARVLVFEIRGTPLPQNQLRLILKSGPIATRAIRVYSEPSHTHLLLIVDQAFNQTPEGRSWVHGKRDEAEPAAIVTTPLQDSEPMVQIPGRPAKDDRIAVHVNGNWPSGAADDRLIADGLVGNGPFAFSTWMPTSDKGDVNDPEQCCSSTNCPQMCMFCGPRFTCCLNSPPGCCAIYCDFQQCCS